MNKQNQRNKAIQAQIKYVKCLSCNSWLKLSNAQYRFKNLSLYVY